MTNRNSPRGTDVRVPAARWPSSAAVAAPTVVHFAHSFCVKPRSVEQVTKNDVGYFKETQGI